MSILILAAWLSAAEEERGVHEPTIRTRPLPADASHLAPPEAPFPWTLSPLRRDPSIAVRALAFPSAFRSPFPENDTVHAEYFTPNVPAGPRAPAAIVLHFLADPGFRVTRLVCEVLARRGIHALMVYMAYYGPRRPPGARLGFLSDDPALLLDGCRQSVWDIRLAASWLAARPDVDPERIGLAGISLGAIVGSLVASVDARFARAALVLGGGDLAEIVWTAPEAREARSRLREKGFTLEEIRRRLQPIEPLRFATPALRDGVLMINALRDETIPRRSADRLWEALGKPEIHWYDTTHVGTAVSILEILLRVGSHLEGRPGGPVPEAEAPPEALRCPGSS